MKQRADRVVVGAANILVIVICIWITVSPNGPVGQRFTDWRAERRQRQLIDSLWLELVDVGDFVKGGGEDVELIEFGDYQCPACGSQHEILNAVDMPVGLVYLQYPLPIHPEASRAAAAAVCASFQGSFVEMHDELFRVFRANEGRDWAALAEKVGVEDLQGFLSCMNESKADSVLAMHRALGDALGIQGTPAFFSRAGYHRGLMSADAIRQALK